MDEHPRADRPALLSFKFGGTALAGSLAMALVAAFAPQPVQIAALGSCVSVLAGLFVAYLEQEDHRERRRAELLERLRVPVALAPDHELFDQYCAISEALAELARQADPVLREVALLKLASLSGEVRSLARGTVVFSATETWRTVYERLLGQPGLGEYLSVAWVKTRDYWQDRPGRQSMRVNYDLVRRGLRIERVLILRDDLWPAGAALPSPAIRPWVDEQNDRGIWLSLVRESELARRAGPAGRLRPLRRPGHGHPGAGRAVADAAVRPPVRPARPEAGPRPLGAAVALRDAVRGPPGPGLTRAVRSDQQPWIGLARLLPRRRSPDAHRALPRHRPARPDAPGRPRGRPGLRPALRPRGRLAARRAAHRRRGPPIGRLNLRRRYPGLAGWGGLDALKGSLRALAGVPADADVHLAGRSAVLMRLVARAMFRRCRRVLHTDLEWPAHLAILESERRRAGREAVALPVRDLVFREGVDAAELAALVAERVQEARLRRAVPRRRQPRRGPVPAR